MSGPCRDIIRGSRLRSTWQYPAWCPLRPRPRIPVHQDDRTSSVYRPMYVVARPRIGRPVPPKWEFLQRVMNDILSSLPPRLKPLRRSRSHLNGIVPSTISFEKLCESPHLFSSGHRRLTAGAGDLREISVGSTTNMAHRIESRAKQLFHSPRHQWSLVSLHRVASHIDRG